MLGTWAQKREIVALLVDAKLGLKPPAPVPRMPNSRVPSASGESLAPTFRARAANLQPSLDTRHSALLLYVVGEGDRPADPVPRRWTAAAHGLPRAAQLFRLSCGMPVV